MALVYGQGRDRARDGVLRSERWAKQGVQLLGRDIGKKALAREGLRIGTE